MIEFLLCKLHVKNYNSIIVETPTPITFFSNSAKTLADALALENWIYDSDLADIPGSKGIYFESWSAEYLEENNGEVTWRCSNNAEIKQGTAKSKLRAFRYIAATMVKLSLQLNAKRIYHP